MSGGIRGWYCSSKHPWKPEIFVCLFFDKYVSALRARKIHSLEKNSSDRLLAPHPA